MRRGSTLHVREMSVIRDWLENYFLSEYLGYQSAMLISEKLHTGLILSSYQYY